MEKQKKIEVLQAVVQIPSVNDGEAEVAEYLAALFAEYGIETERIEYAKGRENLLARLGDGKGKVLGVSGHMDVVSPGEAAQWKYPPFSGQIEGNRLYGRGSTDMKAGLVALAIAMMELKEEGAALHGTVKLLATVGEEVGELGAEQLTQKGYADDLDALIIAEPTGYNLAFAHKGSINYTVLAHGKEAHSSMPAEGFNAIRLLNTCMTELNAKMDAVTEAYQNPVLGRTVHNITVIQGGHQVNSIPGLAQLQGNLRTIPEFPNDRVVAVLQGVVDELNAKSPYPLELHIDFDKIPVQADADSELIATIQKQFAEPLPVGGLPATTDAAEFTKAKKTFDLVIFGPGVPTLPHKVDEYVEIDNYLDMIEVYKKVFRAYLHA